MTFLRSETHYFPRGDVVIQVEGILFKLHRDILETHSDFFRDMLSIPIGDYEEGTTDSHPLRLPPDLCSAKSFTMLCQFIYPTEVGKLPVVQVKDFNIWAPVLEATLALQMPGIQRYIMESFERDEHSIPLEAVGLLSLAMRCDAPLDTLKFECFRTLAYRRQSLSQNEGMLLGAKTATAVMRVRERIRSLFIFSDALQKDIRPHNTCGTRGACQKYIFQQIVKNLSMDPFAPGTTEETQDQSDIFQIDSGSFYCYECGPTLVEIARSLRQAKLDEELHRCVDGMRLLNIVR
ncbi:unnamed protein product [Rhizoctonia solani]|uniref:BTB domain-containing protein n=1 Tax=Rhizoctonia solani TaxID=456999 RepID=A0A8H3A3H2_9AGAM|nr:unnamed protein product [Rhizoctonia solani]